MPDLVHHATRGCASDRLRETHGTPILLEIYCSSRQSLTWNSLWFTISCTLYSASWLCIHEVKNTNRPRRRKPLSEADLAHAFQAPGLARGRFDIDSDSYRRLSPREAR